MTTDFQLGDDVPKFNPWTEDRLGFSEFAKLLSRVIVSVSAPNGYVIGIQGKWGSGKSTALNFVTAYLNKHNEDLQGHEPKVEVVNFRPWMVSGHQDVVAAFFKVLSEELGPKDKGNWLKQRRKRIGDLSKDATNNLVDLVAKMGVAVDHTGGIASKVGGTAVKVGVAKLIDRFLADPSLQATYDELKDKLRSSGRKFLVLIDDIDRLNDDEVRSIMQMVKTVGQLPNIIYLLSYDREIIWNALDGDRLRVGPRFAEKIVQQEIDLPRPSKSDLLTLLDSELESVLGSGEESVRWAYIVRDGVTRWIRAPRDIVRLANAVKFSWLALRGEIDSQDLLAMEGLRLFDETAFNWARDNRDFLFNDGFYQLADEEAKASVGQTLVSSLTGGHKRQITHLMTVLFPQAGKWLQKQHFEDESMDDVALRRGIGCEAGYDAYFSLRPSSDEIPFAVLESFEKSLDDPVALEALLRTYLEKKNSRGEWMVGKLLEELRLRAKRRDQFAPTQALLDALFSVGGEIIAIDHVGGMFTLSPAQQISFLVGRLLERWGADDGAKHLLESFNKSNDPAFCADVYVDRGRELEVFKGSGREQPRIGKEDFDKLGARLLELIIACKEKGTLGEAPFYFDIVRSWVYVGKDPDAVKHWLSEGIQESASFMAKVGIGLLTHSVSSRTGRSFRMREAPDPVLYDAGELVTAGKKHMQESGLSNDQRKVIAEIVRGCQKIVAGEVLSDERD